MLANVLKRGNNDFLIEHSVKLNPEEIHFEDGFT